MTTSIKLYSFNVLGLIVINVVLNQHQTKQTINIHCHHTEIDWPGHNSADIPLICCFVVF